MVQAIRVHAFGGPEVLQFEEIEVGAPGPGEVRLKQHAIGLNFIDIYHREGRYPNPLPFTPGSEASGEVVAVGEGVTDLSPGDRVAYGTAIGAYTEERVVPAGKVVKIPDEISYEKAAVMMLKGMTAQYLVKQTYPVEPGDTILVHAAAGGMGQILCQWGRALGGTVIATVGSTEKADIAKAKGAHHVINYREEDFAARVAEITSGKLVDVVYDGVGKDTFPKSLDCIRPRGLFASFGSASGPIEAFNIMLLAQKGSIFVTRPTLFSYASDRQSLLEMANDVMDAIKTGKITLDVGARFPLKDVADAHKALEARETTGATVLLA